jgi:hypothetical protein
MNFTCELLSLVVATPVLLNVSARLFDHKPHFSVVS